MSEKRKKTVLRTIRMTEDVSKMLEKDAEEKRTTVNGLISSIFTKYAEWDRYAEKFEFLPLSRQFFKSVLEISDEKKLMELAEEQGSRALKESMRFWFKKLDVDSFLSWMSLFSKYGGFTKYELKTDGRNYSIVVNHGLGELWSEFVKRWVHRGMVSSLGIVPNVETTESSVIIEFTR